MENIVSKIALGTVQFGLDYGISNSAGKTPPHEVKRILNIAAKNGINILDTASGYGNSESILGKSGIEKFDVVSKFMGVNTASDLEKQLFETMQKLNTKKLYGYLAHRPHEVFSNAKIWKGLEELKAKGMIEKIGFSFFEKAQIDEMLKIDIVPDIVQVPYNVLDKRFEESAISLKEKGVEIHTRSAFLQGLFFKATEELGTFFAEIVKTIRDYQRAYGENLANHLLRYCLEKEFIDKVVIGINNAGQLSENIDGLQRNFEDANVTTSSTISENILNPAKWP